MCDVLARLREQAMSVMPLPVVDAQIAHETYCFRIGGPVTLHDGVCPECGWSYRPAMLTEIRVPAVDVLAVLDEVDRLREAVASLESAAKRLRAEEREAATADERRAVVADLRREAERLRGEIATTDRWATWELERLARRYERGEHRPAEGQHEEVTEELRRMRAECEPGCRCPSPGASVDCAVCFPDADAQHEPHPTVREGGSDAE